MNVHGQPVAHCGSRGEVPQFACMAGPAAKNGVSSRGEMRGGGSV